MRKSVFLLMVALLSLTAAPSYATAHETDPVTNAAKNNPEEAERAKLLIKRLEEIKAMDKSNLTRVEKKELRKEVRAIKADLRSTGNGVYLSIGAIIIIILLLILLL